mmetsp:Transcript_11044/g.22063  ORF Transcript_11044/g.22063 Transcript_11044/m.22063 type:complete len:340 (-) Transcript_11044:995-2014(-)
MSAKILVITTGTRLGHGLGQDWLACVLNFLELLLVLFLLCISIGIKPFQAFFQCSLHGLLVRIAKFLTQFVIQLVLRGIAECFKVVTSIHLGLDILILLGKFFSFLDHSIDFFLAQSTLVISDGDLLTLATSLLDSLNVQDSIGIDFKSDLDLWLSTRSWWNAVQVKVSQFVIVLGHGTLSLIHLNSDSLLIVLVRGEDLRLLGWNDRVTWNQFGHHPSDSLNSHGQWAHIEQENVLHIITSISSKDSSLDSCSVCDSLIWIDTFVWFLSVEVIFDELLHLWNTSGSSDQDNFMDIILLHAGILKSSLHWSKGFLEQISIQLLESCPCQWLTEVLSINE